jgi:hypothetical protein
MIAYIGNREVAGVLAWEGAIVAPPPADLDECDLRSGTTVGGRSCQIRESVLAGALA